MNKEIKLYLAPMAGATDMVFRRICFQHGCDAATTEMISAQGFLTAPKERNAYQYLLATASGEGELLVQMFGSHPPFMEEAAARLTDMGLFAGIDINMGCPATKIVGGSAGSSLMKTPELAAEIVARVQRATPLPVTVKMRLGWDAAHRNAVPMAKMLEQAGAKMLTVHGRTKEQQYTGHADWEAIAEVKKAVQIPVIANGDVKDGASALEALRVTGCAGLAIGRGALGNPWVFEEIKTVLRGETWQRPSYAAVVSTSLHHAQEMAAWKGERSAVLEMRKHFAWYLSGFRGAAKARTEIHHVDTLAAVEEILTRLAENIEE